MKLKYLKLFDLCKSLDYNLLVVVESKDGSGEFIAYDNIMDTYSIVHYTHKSTGYEIDRHIEQHNYKTLDEAIQGAERLLRRKV